jgi:Holliday junction resolvase RusA-like endonuclease
MIIVNKEIKDEDILLNMQVNGNPISAARPRFSFRSRHAYIPENVKKYQELICWKIKERYPNLKIDKSVNSYGLYINFFRDNRQRIDVDNLTKAIMDAISLTKIWQDDCQVQELFVTKQVSRDNPRVEFILYKTINNSPYVKCLKCGKDMKNVYTSYKRKFCSQECYLEYVKIEYICVICKRRVKVAQSKYTKISKNNVCSRECYFELIKNRNLKRPTKNVCKYCGKKVSRKEYNRCLSCFRKQNYKGNSNYWKNRVIVNSSNDYHPRHPDDI